LDIEKLSISRTLSLLTWSELPKLLKEVYLKNKPEEGCAFFKQTYKEKKFYFSSAQASNVCGTNNKPSI